MLSKLRQVPRLVQAARDNIKEPPGDLRQGRHRHLARRDGVHRRRSAARVSANVDDMHLLGDLADACGEAVQTIGAYVDRSRERHSPEGQGTFRLGRDRFEQKLRLEEGITLPVDRLLAIATRELARDAGRIPPGSPAA